MKIVTRDDGAAPGGAEFAAIELLDALIGRGHEAVMLSDSPEIGRETRVEVRPLELGPKLSTRTWPGARPALAAAAPAAARALEAEAPYDVLLLHYKKEQLLAPRACRRPAAAADRLVRVGTGPLPDAPRAARAGPTLAAGNRAAPVMAISEGTRAARCRRRRRRAPRCGPAERDADRGDPLQRGGPRAGPRASSASPPMPSRSAASPASTRRSATTSSSRRCGARRPASHLILAGAGETEDELRRQAGPLGERAHFLSTPGAEVGDVLSAFDVSVFCPSPTEGQPRAVILGMLAGRPCVSTGAEGVVGLIEDEFGAIVAPENDPAALAAILRGYHDDPERVRREGELAARRAVERFDRAVVAAQAERLILEGRR